MSQCTYHFQCSWGCAGELDGYDPSDIRPEGYDDLGGLKFDQPEPERAFEYPEPPERVILFRELLEKCGYLSLIHISEPTRPY